MATKNELIYDIKEYLKKYSDDSNLSSRHILYMYRVKRARSLRQLFNDNKKSFDKSIIQSLCVGLEETASNLCGGSSDCNVLRSVKPIPKLLDLKNRESLLAVTPTSLGAINFKIISSAQLPYIFDRQYSDGIFIYQDVDNYLNVITKKSSAKLLECLYVQGIFENPEDLSDFVTCCSDGCTDSSTPCFDDDTEYPLQPFLIDAIRNEILKELVPREKLREDKDNNSDEE